MPSTTYTDATFSVSTIGGRTDSAGAAVTDFTAEEVRLSHAILTEGCLSTNAFIVAAQTSPNMSVKVGSGTAKADIYVVAADLTGQGNYIVRADATSTTVAIDAADVSQSRTDEIYLVVSDNVYDASARSLPRLGYRKGAVGGAVPGPDSSWKASALLARVTVAAGATSIGSGAISDQRTKGGVTVPGTLTGSALAVPALTLNGTDLTTALAGKASSTHGHDPIASTMTGSARGYAKYYSDIGEAIGSGSFQKVGFYLPIASDSLVTWTSEVPGDSFTVNASGIWAVTTTFRYPASSAGGERHAEITAGSPSVTLVAQGSTATAGQPYTHGLHWTGYLAAGTKVRVWAIQQSGQTLTIEASSDGAWRNITLALVRRAS